MSNKIAGSLTSKVLGVLLLCVLGASIMYNGFGIIYLEGQSFPDKLESYTESVVCNYQVQDTALNIFSLYSEYDIDVARNTYSFGDYSNLSFTLEEYDTTTKKYSDACDNTKAIIPDSYSEYTFYFAKYSDSTYVLYTELNDALTTGKENIDSVYRMNLYLQNPLTVHDEIYNQNILFNAYYFRGLSELFTKVIIELVLFVFVLIFEFAASGHKNGYEGIHLLWLDHIPYELILFYLFIISFISAISLPSINAYTTFSITYIYMYIAEAMFISLNIYMVLMTTARRLKGNVFFETCITYHIFLFIYHAFVAIPVVYKVSIPAIIYFIVELFIFDSQLYGRRFYFNVVLSLIACIAVILLAYQFSFVYKAGKELVNGNKNYKINEDKMKLMIGEIKEHASNLNELSDGISLAVEKEMKSERLKAELITNVSHDIKTPLTSIINYTDLLSKEHTDEEEKQYIDVLSRQSNKLKKLIEDLIEASKASTGNISTTIAPINIRELMEQSIAEYDEKLNKANLEVVLTIKDEPISVYADGRLLWRVLSNLFSNVSKYALGGTRVYIDVNRCNTNEVLISIKNISKDQLNINPDELTERFVRGDLSRHTEGSGLGLNIVKSLVEVQKGRFELSIDGDLFKANIYLPENV